MIALYNEIESYAARWLRNLMAAGHIAQGDVDERSIRDLRPGDLAGREQCHFFAGIGVWSYALRLAGWPDGAPVWTGSCPCQPFSRAGRRRGFDDERHLWPAWFSLIRECRPPTIFGEQVASPDGLGWLDAVFSDLEHEGYACGAADLCAAGVGAPHIRQRLYFVAVADGRRPQVGRPAHDAGDRERAHGAATDRDVGAEAAEHGHARLLADSVSAGRPEGRAWAGSGQAPSSGGSRLVGDASSARGGWDTGAIRSEKARGDRTGSFAGRLADEPVASGAALNPWAVAEWLPCRDGKARPAEPGSFPLAHGAPARVGRLRAYGNAIVPQVAATFIRAAMGCAS